MPSLFKPDTTPNFPHNAHITPPFSLANFHRHPINAYLFMGLVALFLLVTANVTFFTQVNAVYPFAQYMGFFISLAVVLFGIIWLLFALFGYKYTLKAVLILFILIASATSYFTDTYGTVYDTNMLQNAMQTDKAESADLLNAVFILRLVLLGALPAFLVARQRVFFAPLKRSLMQRVITVIGCLALVGLPIMAFSKQYASFFREHKAVRFYTNPVTPIYAVGSLIGQAVKQNSAPKNTIMHASDATQTTLVTTRKPKLMVMVVGETARADHSSLNGYPRDTMPKLGAIGKSDTGFTNFPQVTSCGTSTAYSVPCMFSYVGEKKYDVDTTGFNENVLETLNRLKINVLWRDNNSDSKGVMNRLPKESYVSFKTKDTNTVCTSDGECRDVGMLVGLDDYVKAHQGQDILLVLHQMGNHGPAYYKRYDKQFEKFTPVCQSNELAKCDKQSVINAFDNAFLATDDFLAKTIGWLKPYDGSHQVAMLYMSDHGESLGEKGVYLHGMPNAFAPPEQKHVPAVFWAGSQSGLKAVPANTALTHDAIAPTLLKLFDVKTEAVNGKATFVE